MVRNRALPVRDSLEDVLKRAFVVELGVLVALLVGVEAYVVGLDGVLDPYFLDSDIALSVVRGALTLAGMGVLTAAYASWRGHSLPVSLPDRTDGRLVAVAVAGTAALAVLSFVPVALRTGVGLTHVASVLGEAADVLLGRTLVRIAVFVAGMVLLYHGLVQAGLGRVLDGDLAVVVTTLVGGYLVLPGVPSYGTSADVPWLYLWGSRAVVAALVVLALGVAAYAAGRVDDGRMHTLAMLPGVAALALAALDLATTVEGPAGAVVVGSRVAVVGIAAYGYDRTASMATPTLTYATFAVVSTLLHAAAADAFLAA